MFNWNKRNTTIAVSIAVYAIFALLLMLIINNAAITSWLNSALAVLSPIIVGAAIAYLCNPILRIFENKVFKHLSSHRMRRALSIVCTYLVVFLILTAILLIVIPQLQSSYNDFTKNINTYTTQAIAYINRIISNFDSTIGEDNIGEYISVEDIQAKIGELLRDSSQFLSNIADYVISYGTSLVSGMINVLFGLFFSIYILSSKERLGAQLRKLSAALMNEHRFNSLMEWCKFANLTFGKFIKATLLDALIVTILATIAFTTTSLPYALLLAFIVGITNVIPVFGAFLGGVLAGFIVLIAEPSKTFLVVLLIFIIQQLDGNVLKPNIFGRSTGLSSFGVLCAIIIMGGYFGITGMILGVPVFVVIGAIIRNIVDARLQKKNMSTDLSDYYAPGSLVVGSETENAENEKGIFAKLLLWILKLLKYLLLLPVRLFNKIFKRKK